MPNPSRTGGQGGRRPAADRQSTGSGAHRAGRPQPGRPRPGRQRPGSPGGLKGLSQALDNHRIVLAQPTPRLRWMLVSMLVVLTLFVGRALQLQVIDSKAYAAKAARQMTHTVPIAPQRGTITDRFGTVMAVTVPAVTILADPSMIARNGVTGDRPMTTREAAIAQAAPGAIAAILARHLGGKPADYLPALTAKGTDGKLVQYRVVKQQVETSVWNDIQTDLRAGGAAGQYTAPYWYGLYKQDNPKRTYPSGSVAGNVIGTMSNGKAITGVEKYLDASLTGTPGYETYESSAYGRIPLGTETLVPATNGTNYQLTIDATLQQAAEAALAKYTVAAHASTGTAIVMNVKTGEVLADASLPGYDPNKISATAAKNSLLNRSVENMYEPGSVEKVLTMGALADKGLVTAETKVVVPPRLASGGGYINDSFSHNTLYLYARGVIALSSNIGTVELTRQMDKATFVNYLKSFGLGQKTGIELPNETAGLLPSADLADYSRDQIAFGQGVSVNAVQEAAAVSAIVNDGVYNPPTLLKAATGTDGAPVALPSRQPRRVISKEASAQVRDMMAAVIALSKTRAIAGYNTIGKSGTAERPDGHGGYSGFTASFVMAAPAEDPQILVYVVLDQPLGDQHQGSEVSLPAAQEIMKLALPRYGVKPATTPATAEPIRYQK